MTRMELIVLIGDVLTRLDVLRGSLSPGAPGRQDLDELRNQLDARQLQLAQTQFNENTASFQAATEKLKVVNTDLKATLNDLDKLVTTIGNLRRFVTAVDGIIGAILPVFV